MKQLTCRYCGKTIQKRDQLITASNWLRVRPYHYVCFSEVEKEASTIYNNWTPVNVAAANITSLIMAVLAGWLLFVDTWGLIGDLIGALAFYRVLIRLFSYFFIEINVPK
ncbi:hypothetical protein [Sediminibacillus albus]|uniref:Uncharacterized protein n=1 Tax=Sediminibacillus albus TaxID=407036 RepID=A0A1G9CAF4_9BACI|nr:hypothetical protein [Sediminibacillus albus]SDK48616.1 hypothetical protein SAMN05216243_3339 [Sediminibacillus albus]